jgi:hypothetical protein
VPKSINADIILLIALIPSACLSISPSNAQVTIINPATMTVRNEKINMTVTNILLNPIIKNGKAFS